MMHRLLTVFIFTIIAALHADAQENGLDSLVNLLNQKLEPRKKVDVLNELSSAYYDNDVTTGHGYAVKAYDLAKSLNYTEGQRTALTLKAYYYYYTGNYREGLSLYHQAIALPIPEGESLGYTYSMLGNLFTTLAEYDSADLYYKKAIGLLEARQAKLRLAYAYKSLGKLYTLRWRNKEAESYLLKSVEIYERLNKKRSLVDTWFALSEVNKNMANFQKALAYSDKGCEIAAATNDEYMTLRCQLSKGQIQYHQGEFKPALQCFLNALDILKSKDLPLVLLQTYSNLGDVYEALEQYDLGLKYYFEALKIAEQLGLKYEIARVNVNIAWIYNGEKNFTEARKTVNKSLEISKAINDENGQSFCYSLLGVINTDEGNYDEAIKWLQDALAIRQRVGNLEGVSSCFYNLSAVFEMKKDFQKAIDYNLKSMAIEESIQNKYNLGDVYNYTGKLYGIVKNYKEAVSYLKKGEQLASESGSKRLMMDNNLYWSELYESQGKLRESLEKHKKYLVLKDSINDELRSGKLAELQALYQVEKKDEEIRLLNQENALHTNQIQLQKARINQQNSIIVFIIVGFVLLSLLLFKTYQFNRNIRKAHREITEQKEEIQSQSEELREANQIISDINKQLEEKIEERTSALRQAYKELDTFFYRSSHDFRRPLTTFLGLSEVAKITVKDQNALELFAKVRDTAKNLDKMLVKLQSISDVGAQQLVFKEVFIEDLFQNVCDGFREELKSHNVKTVIDVKVKEPFFSYPAMVKIIIDNLVENSIVFAYAEHPIVKLRARQESNNIIIEIEDNGQGIEEQYQDKIFEMYFRGTERSHGNGLGLYIVKKAVEKLNGDISFISTFEKGSVFRITLPMGQELQIG